MRFSINDLKLQSIISFNRQCYGSKINYKVPLELLNKSKTREREELSAFEKNKKAFLVQLE